jgi:ubiquinone/menaquinone biosynthesis C-methylase UbiE
MKLNRVERWFVFSPVRRLMQYFVVQWFRRAAPGGSFDQVLEIGCGGGTGAAMIATNFTPRRLHLMDIDPAMVARALTALAQRPPETVAVYVADATFLPFREASMDAVFGFGFLHHVPAWRASLREIVRVLKPGGVYYMEEFYPSLYQNLITRRILVHPDQDRFTSLELKEAFADSGLRLQQTFELKRFGILGIGVKII